MSQRVNNAEYELREIIAVGSVSIWRLWKWNRGETWAMRSGVNQRFAVKSRGSFTVVGLGVDRRLGRKFKIRCNELGPRYALAASNCWCFSILQRYVQLLNYPLFCILQLFSASANTRAVLVLIYGNSKTWLKFF